METLLTKHFAGKLRLPATCDELLKSLKLAPDQRPELKRSLRNLERRGIVALIGAGRYLSSDSPDLVSGRIQITRGGRGFLAADDPEMPEVAIPAAATGTALHEDRVVVLLDEEAGGKLRRRSAEAPTARVVGILERRRNRFVGTLKQAGRTISVMPDDPRFSREIELADPPKRGTEAKPGAKVVVEMLSWTSRREAPRGRLVEVLGAPDERGVDMLGVLRQYELESEFPAEVVREAQRFGRNVRDEDLDGRRDCRDHRVVTIDPDDARDFDDAICLEPAGRRRWRLWVHIADVSHYVRPGSALDREARRRGNSSYLVDRVVPMLPEALSNELCSLKPGVDRLTKCAEFLLSQDGKVLGVEFYPAVIRSQRRFTYAEAMESLEREPRDATEEMIHRASELAQCLRKRRFAGGSLDLDFPETKIRLDQAGRISRIDRHENDASHQLVEECMLLANEAAAARLSKRKLPALYRSHESPDPDRLASYREEVRSHSIPCGNLSKPGEAVKLLLRLREVAVGGALKIGFLRSLNRARYTAEPLGHFGLAKRKYTHFTSPIRRYADLVVHRSLFSDAKASKKQRLADGEVCYREMAAALSATERNSSDAERDSKELKLHAHLQHQIRSGKRERYDAKIVSLNGVGLCLDVEALGMGGMVPYSLLRDDRYVLDAEGRCARGVRTKRAFCLGDVIEIEIAKVDALRKRVDFQLAKSAGAAREKAEQSAPGEGKRRRRSRGRSSNGSKALARNRGEAVKS